MIRYHTHWILALAIVLAGAVAIGIASPITAISQAEQYLIRFGYLSPKNQTSSDENLLDQDTWEKAIMEFQSFAGLNVTGELDGETMQLMSLPRCGVKDKDIQGIQTLYGPKTKNGEGGGSGAGGIPTRTPRPKTPTELDSELCTSPKIDAVFNTADGSTYAFKGDKYYKLTENAVAEGYPKKISDGWPGLPGNIDAAFTYKNGKTYFFQGTKYWRYQGRQVDGDYPQEISEGFTGVPDHPDAAMVWGGNGKIYFFKGSQFWRFDTLRLPPVKSTYPKPISTWEGVPNNIDAALQYTNGYTYFFKDDKYYRFNDRTFTVDQSDPPFPRPTAHWWYGCPTTLSTSNTQEDS